VKLKVKVWLQKEEKLIFGKGKASILKSIDKTGSINKSAKEMDMSYRRAWSCIRSIEERTGQAMLIKNKGGKNGGGALLTDYAKNLVEKFAKLEEDITNYSNQLFSERFKENGSI